MALKKPTLLKEKIMSETKKSTSTSTKKTTKKTSAKTTKAKTTAKQTTAKVKKGDTVSIHYVGTLNDGEQFDSSYDRGKPVDVEVGSGMLISGFDNALVGMQIGKKKKVAIPKDEAYGDPKDEAFVSVPREGFPEDFPFEKGTFVPLTNESGQQMVGRLHETLEEEIVVDLNHPMAGKDLNFDIEVLSIKRDVTE
jgi:FKBP-type peptidyl-prolyl cis-trans isomerase 2